ncbi:MAG TPA: phosphoglucomutase/phosphomannomutase family protein [Dehalococcoidia bacterium]|nr:phosphoglucomutase/phosphomannomutase family protein [Dehalococcoidia bacterium]
MTENPVKFGTDGWRALIGDTFTFENVRACAQATAEHFAESRGTAHPLVVGWDTRFLSQDFASEVAGILAGNGFAVELADRPAPTPALSYRVVETQAAGGVMVTSSHNPARWNGIKVKPHYGGSASPEVVADIERRVPRLLRDPSLIRDRPADSVARFDPVPGYLAALAEKVDIDRIRSAGLRISYDPMYGTGAGLLEALVEGGSTRVITLHSERNPAFPGLRAPEPIEANLGELLKLTGEGEFAVGIANDGDADRLGVVDERGRYLDQLRAFALLVNYMLNVRGLRGPVVKSLTTTAMAQSLSDHYGVPCIETPVGFKHIGPIMMERDALIGGEESGGYGFRGHLPERDGLLAALFLLDYIASTGRTPSELVEDVFAITGPHFYKRLDFELDPGASESVRARLDAAKPSEVAGREVTEADQLDGWRFKFEGGWLLFRLSGTEPLLRIYTEVDDESCVEPVLAAGTRLAGY